MVAAEKLKIINDPFIQNYLSRLMKKELGLAVSLAGQQNLEAAVSPKITTATVRAVQLGHKISKDNGSSLGRYVHSKVEALPEKIEEGRYSVYGYYRSEELDNAINEYYELAASNLVVFPVKS